MTQYNILLADDDDDFVEAMKVRLRSQGYKVITAADAYQAVHFAREYKPDLLLLDINMPAGDGFSVHDRLQKTPEVSAIPVIYLTGERSDRVKIGAMKSHCRVIHKPFNTQDLLDEIEVALAHTHEFQVSP